MTGEVYYLMPQSSSSGFQASVHGDEQRGQLLHGIQSLFGSGQSQHLHQHSDAGGERREGQGLGIRGSGLGGK